MSEPIRVLIADDHDATREEVVLALEPDDDFLVCALASDAVEAVRLATETHPDLCLLDVRMPGGGVRAAWEIRSRLPRCRVVMLSISEDDEDILGALRAGASGYLLKEMDAHRLPRALRSVMEGEVALPRALVATVVEEFRDRHARRRAPVLEGVEGRLTSREWEVLDLVRQGLTTAEIADKLVLSPVTVRTHANSVARKLNVGNRSDIRASAPGASDE